MSWRLASLENPAALRRDQPLPASAQIAVTIPPPSNSSASLSLSDTTVRARLHHHGFGRGSVARPQWTAGITPVRMQRISANAFDPLKDVCVSFSLPAWQVVPVGYVAGFGVGDVTVDLRDPAQRHEPALLLSGEL